jgi:hypothetical protein
MYPQLAGMVPTKEGRLWSVRFFSVYCQLPHSVGRIPAVTSREGVPREQRND